MTTTQYGNAVHILGICPDDHVQVRRVSDGQKYMVHVSTLKADGGSEEIWAAIKQTASWKRNTETARWMA